MTSVLDRGARIFFLGNGVSVTSENLHHDLERVHVPPHHSTHHARLKHASRAFGTCPGIAAVVIQNKHGVFM